MEKLIKLLNEREKELSPSIQVEWTEFSVGINKWYLISKECWFIQWLVDNDKIYLEEYKDKSELYTLKVIYWTAYYIDLLTNKVNSDFLLMLLSIQDNPIEFLVSILK